MLSILVHGWDWIVIPLISPSDQKYFVLESIEYYVMYLMLKQAEVHESCIKQGICGNFEHLPQYPKKLFWHKVKRKKDLNFS